MSRRRSLAAQRLSTAYHEAGHAVVATILRVRLTKVSIIPNHEEGIAGHCLIPLPSGFDPTRPRAAKLVRNRIVVLVAGTVAKLRHDGDSWEGNWVRRAGSEQDCLQACFLAGQLSPSARRDKPVAIFVDELFNEASARLKSNWPEVVVVAERLVLEGQLSGATVRRIVRESREPRVAAALAEIIAQRGA